MNSSIYKLAKVKINQVKMMKDRGYDILDDETEYLYDGLNYFNKLYKGESKITTKLNNFYYRYDEDADGNEYKEGIVVYYAFKSDNSKGDMRRDDVNTIINSLTLKLDLFDYDTDVKKLLLITPAKIANKEMVLFSKFKDLQILGYEDLGKNPTEHKLYSQHIKLTEKEKISVLKELGVKSSQLCILRENYDAIVKWFGWKKQDMIKIYREIEYDVSEDSIQYRIVC